MLKRIMSFLMCALLLLGAVAVFGGCSDNEEEETTGGAVTYDESDEYVAPDVNFNGRDFVVYTWAAAEDWVLDFSDQLSKVEQETYYHLATVEQELGLNFKTVEQAGSYYQMSDFVSRLYNMSGDDGIDLVCQYSLAAAVGTHQGVYANLMDLDYVKWNAEYWSQELRAANTVNGKMFWCTGDMTASTIKNMFLITFNFDMAANYQMGDLYQTVRDKEWTIEKLKTLTTNIYTDDNKSGVADVGDTFGFVAGNYVSYDAFQYGCNLTCLVKNSLDELEVNSDLYGERGINITNKIKDLLHNSEGTYNHDKTKTAWETAIEEEKAVFSLNTASQVMNSLVKSEVNYGILPLPMYDSDQDGYHTALAMTYSMFTIPVIAKNPDMSAAVLESMAHCGYVKLAPAVFEALQYRYSKRADDTEMLTILRDGIIYDPGRIIETVDIFSIVRSTVRDNLEIATKYKEREKGYKSALADVSFMFS